ncbi:MAG: FtsW/RodA/SpoVE family cell cycle protein [Chloroflexi bacterium]|nr:FtsW/RodA/SpoVE family cell cycle protein [Chloroflexota bacterium]
MQPLRRFGELRLLVLVALLLVTGFVAVVATELASFAPVQPVVPLLFIALAVALHLFLVTIGFRGDQLLLPLMLALTAIGLIEVERLASNLLLQQLSWCVVAAGVFVVAILVPRDLSVLARYKYTWALLGIALLLSPLLPGLGREINGARIWIGVGFAQFQPSEAVKVLLVIFFASYLDEYREVLTMKRLGPLPLPPVPYLLPIILMWGMAMVVMVFEKDLGATLIFFGIFLAMLYLATGQTSYTLLGALLLFGGAYLAYRSFGHVAVRVDTWLEPFAGDTRFSSGYQLVQGLFALGNAGLLGAGLGGGLPERIPVVWSDFVFDAFTEETGFLGGAALLALYLVLVFRGMIIALRAPTTFLQLLAGGLSFIIAFQTLVIVGGNARLIPLTGVTLPFIAYGGSSLVANFLIVALLLRVSDVTARVRGPA